MLRTLIPGASLLCALAFVSPAAAGDWGNENRPVAQEASRVGADAGQSKATSTPDAKTRLSETHSSGKRMTKAERRAAAKAAKLATQQQTVTEGRAALTEDTTGTAEAPAQGGFLNSMFKTPTAEAAEVKPATNLQALAARYAAEQGIPFAVAHGVIMTESRYNARATGPGGYIGLMQLSYRTAQGMGYRGSRAALYEPATNLRYGMQYLAEAYRQTGGNLCQTVSKYQGGHGVSGVTRAGAKYCGSVKRHMASMGAAPAATAKSQGTFIADTR